MNTRVHIIGSFYNEEFLVPFFLSHYGYADRIHALVTPGTDNTIELLRAHPKVELHMYAAPDGMDDGLKIRKVNWLVAALQNEADWIISVDADEFVWPEGQPTGDARAALDQVPSDKNVVFARMWQVFRHKTDADLDPKVPPVVFQRRHGIQDRLTGGNAGYAKPIIIRTGFGMQFEAGQHRLQPNYRTKYATQTFDGAHWAMADAAFAIQRRVRDRKNRQSANNKKVGWGCHNQTVTEEELRGICKQHLDDPQLF